MEDWGMDKAEKAKLDKAKREEEKKQYDDGRLFKIYHEKEGENERSLKDDLRIAAKKSAHKRNRSPDDGFQLVGDRRRNVNVIAPEDSDESSEGEKELSVTEMMEECKDNAMRIHKEQERRERKLAARERHRGPEEGKERRRKERSGARPERRPKSPHGEERPKKRPVEEPDYDAYQLEF